MDAPYRILGYDPDRYPFPALIRDVLRGGPLKDLHLREGPLLPALVSPATEQRTRWHSSFYAAFAQRIAPLYWQLVREVIAPLYPLEAGLFVQEVPIFRVQYPLNMAVSDFHRDTDFGHPAAAVNYLLPLVATVPSCSVWLETRAGAPPVPVPVQVGEILEFRGGAIRHGNVVSTAPYTRTSFDFRVGLTDQWSDWQQPDRPRYIWVDLRDLREGKA